MPVRLSLDEGDVLDTGKTAAILHMALTIHGREGLTDACATDGGRMGPPEAAGMGGKHSHVRVAWGAICSIQGRTTRVTMGGALPAGSSVQDAELTAIVAAVRRVLRSARASVGTPVGERRLLLLVDSAAVLQDIETTWRAGRAEAYRLRHRRAMLEEIARSRQQMGGLVTLWVRGHSGVFPNSYADALATAHLDEDPVEGAGSAAEGGDGHGCEGTDGASSCAERQQQATLVRYEVEEEDGAWWRTSADRRVGSMARRRGQGFEVRSLLREMDEGRRQELLLDYAQLRGEPSRMWTALITVMSEGGADDKRGSRKAATRLGAVMMLRDGRVGMPAELSLIHI